MLLHVHRDSPPFRTQIAPSTAVKAVTLGLAPELMFESEGERTRLRCTPEGQAGRTRAFAIALGRTTFERSDVTILSLVLTPLRPGSEESALNEYDVIKLVKLWEGGEGVHGAPSAIAEGRDLWFATARGEQATLHKLVGLAFPGWQPLGYGRAPCAADVVTVARNGYRVGTVELELAASECKQLFEDIGRLKRRREAPESGEGWDRAVAVGGILQGLLDFRRIEEDELADVFADVDIDPVEKTMHAFHKGTLLWLSGEADDGSEDEAEERPSLLGINPYLAVPNIVLLHDEERLKKARLREHDLSARQRAALAHRAAIDETEHGLNEIAALLAQTLPNVFHYSSERRLQKRGRSSRGLDDLETLMRRRIDDLSSVLESRVRRRDRWTAVLGVAVGVVTAFLVQQAIEGRPLWIVVVAAVSLFGVFLWLRDQLF